MSYKVNTNMSSILCQNSLNKANKGLNTALKRMSTGLRINSAMDDAAGSAIATKLDVETSSYKVAQMNTNMGMSILETASGSLSVMTSMLQRMRDLSEQAANGTYGAAERKAMQSEVDALTRELYRIKNSTDFNGKKILGEELGEPEEPDRIVPEFSMSDINIDTITQTEWNTKYRGHSIGISSAEDLAKIATINNRSTNRIGCDYTTFVLTGNIDLNDLGDVDGNGSNWIPIGDSEATKFYGNFNGNNYTISNLTINSSNDYQGLFGYICGTTDKKCANITDLNLENVNIKGKQYVGGLVARTKGHSAIINCSVSGIVTGTDKYTGGLVGLLSGLGDYGNNTVSNCTSSANVNSNGNSTGGLIGEIYSVNNTITNCSSTGIITSTAQATAGLIGFTGGGTGNNITNCCSSATVSCTTNQYVGGLVGYNAIAISNSYSTGSVKGGDNTGGLVGHNAGANAIIADCYSSSYVEGKAASGGLIGQAYTQGKISNSYSTGEVSGTMYTGGLIGICRESTVDNCYTLSHISASTGDTNKGAFIGQYHTSNTLTNNQYNGLVNPGIAAIGNFTVREDEIRNNTELSVPVKPEPDICKINLQVGIDTSENSRISIDTGFMLGDFKVSLASETSSRSALDKIDKMLSKVNAKSLDIASTQNRLQSVLEFQTKQIEVKTESSSLIKDADIAKESAAYIKNQILQQATTSLLATANQSANIALTLLGKKK